MATGIIKMLHLQLDIKYSCCTYSVLIHSIIPVSVCFKLILCLCISCMAESISQ